jgi:hypothetical protein
MPLGLFSWGVRRILNREKTFVFYFHPWEIDPNQPQVKSASFPARFKHYTNLNKVAEKLGSFIEMFSDCQYLSCADYLKLQFPTSLG